MIVMRLDEGDRSSRSSAFRPGWRSALPWATMTSPEPRDGRTRRDGPGTARRDAPSANGRPACTPTSSRSTTATRTLISPRKIAATSASEPGRAEVFQFANENIFVKILDNVREKDVFLVQPTSHPVNQSIMELLIMIDAFKRAQRGADHGRHPLLRLRPVRQEGPAPGPDHGPPHRRHDHGRRRRPGADDGPPPGPDPGLLQHPGRRADRGPPARRTTSATSTSRTSSSSPTSASPSAPAPSRSCSTPRSRSSRSAAIGNLDRAELMNVIGEVRGRRAIIVDDEIDTAGTLIEIVRALEREGVDRDLRLRHARGPVRPGHRPDPRLEPARGRPHRLDPAARGQAHPQDHDALGRAAHRRGHQADPSRRVGRRALLSEVSVHPGDAALGGRLPDGATRDPATGPGRDRRGPRHAGLRPSYAPSQVGRSMSSSSTVPTARAASSAPTVDDRNWRNQLRSPRWGAALRRRPPAGAREPGDEPDVDAACDRVLGRPGGLTFVLLLVGYASASGFWH